MSRLISQPPLFAVTLLLAACWTAPIATVTPQGEARLILDAIAVRSVKSAAVVSSVDRTTDTIVLRIAGRAGTSTYPVGPKTTDLDDIKPGDEVQATLADELAVYLLPEGQVSGAGSTMRTDARVLKVDPSYRLLTLQYPDGRNETFKVPLGTKLDQMAGGDSVVIRPIALLGLRRKG